MKGSLFSCAQWGHRRESNEIGESAKTLEQPQKNTLLQYDPAMRSSANLPCHQYETFYAKIAITNAEKNEG
ncbi:hypothetical protein HLI_16250 [Halobacillus litoralis]|uniref:Uncharacterized protein n=1 Tax=Halobacillus litoralis TaxID=45668 RepID=A0A410MFY9_9BACI|nr:hypothetical protein HLI_16250 [Halobacillus litoralis]